MYPSGWTNHICLDFAARAGGPTWGARAMKLDPATWKRCSHATLFGNAALLSRQATPKKNKAGNQRHPPVDFQIPGRIVSGAPGRITSDV